MISGHFEQKRLLGFIENNYIDDIWYRTFGSSHSKCQMPLFGSENSLFLLIFQLRLNNSVEEPSYGLKLSKTL